MMRAEQLLAESLDSSAFQIFINEQVKLLRQWSHQLLENPDLPEHERRGLVIARLAIKRGIVEIYAKAGKQPPAYLQEQLNFYDGER